MKIYTGKGDQGKTSLWGKERVEKNDARVETYGSIDEANSVLGMARNLVTDREIKKIIYQVQKTLFTVAAEIAAAEPHLKSFTKIGTEETRELEILIDKISKDLSPVKGFIIPGDSKEGAFLDFARTVIRRTERLAVGLLEQKIVSEQIVAYLNRLSDLLFVLARRAEHQELVQTVRRQVVKELWRRNFIEEEETSQLTITLDRARQIVNEARLAAEKIGVHVAVSVVDAGGNLVIFERMDSTILVATDLSQDKAYTAASLKMPTHELGEKAAPGGALFGIQETHGGRIVIFGGGFPLIENGRLLGGIGVSGGSVEEDILIAQAGLKVFQKLF